MPAPTGQVPAVFVGRTGELAVVRSVLERAQQGIAGALLLTGDAGVGKSTVVQQAVTGGGADTLVLAGGGLPTASVTVPFLGLRSAFRTLPPDLTVPDCLSEGERSSRVAERVDAWVDEITANRAVVLIIDDLHWTDQSTLDVLLYLLAGPRERRLAILTTLRESDVAEGHPLNTWLADVRRLPGFEVIGVGPLTRIETAEQVSGLLRTPAHESLIDEVFARTRGNCYLTRLLVTGLDPFTAHLPARLPADLEGAVLATWHGLSAAGRDVTTVLAVGGHRQTTTQLAKVMGGLHDIDQLGAVLREATGAGVLDLAEADGSYWFHHPLQAEVLVRHVPLDERRRWHEVFAGHFEAALQADDDAELLALVAEHHFLADHQEEAYRWCIRAADGMVSRSPERLRLLQRAVDLRPLVPHDRLSRADLLWLLKDTAESAAALRVELDAVDELLTELDRSSDSARCAELMVRRMYLRFSLGLGFITRAQADEAAQVGSGATDSWQYALAAAAQAHAAMWEGASDAHDLADRAVALATSAGHPRARSYACTAMSSIMLDQDPEAAGTWASRGREFALESGDFWAYTHAVMWECNAVDVWTAPQTLELVARRRLEAQAEGAPHHYLAWLANAEAGGRLAAGRWRESAELLRLSLGSEPGPVVDVNARLHSGRLAALQGRPDEATAHLDRVRELIADPSTFRHLPYDAIHAEVLLAAGDPTGALEVVQRAVNLAGVAPTNCEWLLPLGARALADQVELVRGRGSGRRRDEPEVLLRLKELDDLVRRFPGVVPDIGVPMSFVRDFFDATPFYRSQLEALDAWYRAEVGRAHRRPSNLDEWVRAATLLTSAGLPWEAAYAGWRAAQACLLGARPDRSRAATWLRRSAALAEDLRALPVLDEVRALARAARISLEQVDHPVAGPLVDTLGLTHREREVLAHVAAGRTYAEIATALALSEKTVSSHISHMLSKTGTANRVELAALSREGE